MMKKYRVRWAWITKRTSLTSKVNRYGIEEWDTDDGIYDSYEEAYNQGVKEYQNHGEHYKDLWWAIEEV